MNYDFLFNREYWKDTFARTLYTMAEAFFGCIGGATIFDVDWKPCIAIVLTAGVTTVIKCYIVAYKNGFHEVEEVTVDEIEDLYAEEDDDEIEVM